MSTPILISIGTSHPWNVAGTGRDLVVATAFGVRVFTAVAAVSAQDAGGVRALQTIEPNVFAAQLGTLPWAPAGAVRVGALPTAEAVRAVASHLRANPSVPAVVDPVFAASRGGELADAAAREAMRDELAILPNVILTPNLAEAAHLLAQPRIERDEITDAALRLQRRGARAVVLKGGHLDGEPADALATGGGCEIFSDARIAAEMRGTGCTLAVVLACELAAGRDLRDAVVAARAFVRNELAAR